MADDFLLEFFDLVVELGFGLILGLGLDFLVVELDLAEVVEVFLEKFIGVVLLLWLRLFGFGLFGFLILGLSELLFELLVLLLVELVLVVFQVLVVGVQFLAIKANILLAVKGFLVLFSL